MHVVGVLHVLVSVVAMSAHVGHARDVQSRHRPLETGVLKVLTKLTKRT